MEKGRFDRLVFCPGGAGISDTLSSAAEYKMIQRRYHTIREFRYRQLSEELSAISGLLKMDEGIIAAVRQNFGGCPSDKSGGRGAGRHVVFGVNGSFLRKTLSPLTGAAHQGNQIFHQVFHLSGLRFHRI